MDTLNTWLFWRIVRDLPFAELCRAQRVCRLWRRRLTPAPHHSYYWSHVFAESGYYFVLRLANFFFRCADSVAFLPYHGDTLARAWFDMNGWLEVARMSLFREWLADFKRGKRKPYRYLSSVARAMLYRLHVYQCKACRILYFGPFPPTHRPDCHPDSGYRLLNPRTNTSRSPRYVSPLLELGSSFTCARCGIYGHIPRSKYCLFCQPK